MRDLASGEFVVMQLGAVYDFSLVHFSEELKGHRYQRSIARKMSHSPEYSGSYSWVMRVDPSHD